MADPDPHSSDAEMEGDEPFDEEMDDIIPAALGDSDDDGDGEDNATNDSFGSWFGLGQAAYTFAQLAEDAKAYEEGRLPRFEDDHDWSLSDLTNGRSIGLWDESIRASSLLIKKYNAFAALSPPPSDHVQYCFDRVRTIISLAQKNKKERANIHSYCIKTLSTLLKVAALEATYPNRNEAGVATSLILQVIYKHIIQDQDSFASFARQSVVKRVRDAASLDALGVSLDAFRWMMDDVDQDIRRMLASTSSISSRPTSNSAGFSEPWSFLKSELLYWLSDSLIDLATSKRALMQPDYSSHVLVLASLYPFLHKIRPATNKADPARLGQIEAMAEELVDIELELTDKQYQKAIGWLKSIIEEDTVQPSQGFSGQEQLMKWIRLSRLTIRVGHEFLSSVQDWAFAGALDVALGLVTALCHVNHFKYAVVVAEIAAVHLREAFERIPSPDSRLRLVNAIGVVSFVTGKTERKLLAHHAAETAIRLLQPLYDERPEQHQALMARLLFHSAQALFEHPNKEFNALARLKSNGALEKYQRASKADPTNVHILQGLAEATELCLLFAIQDNQQDQQLELRVRIIRLYRQLYKAAPLIYDGKFADVLRQSVIHLNQSSAAARAAIKEALRIYKDRQSRWSSEGGHGHIAEAYRVQAVVEERNGDLSAAVSSLRHAIRAKSRSKVIPAYCGLPESLPYLSFTLSLIYMRLGKYSSAEESMIRARDLWHSSGQRQLPSEVVSKTRYVLAVVDFMLGHLKKAHISLKSLTDDLHKQEADEHFPDLYFNVHDPDFIAAMGELAAVNCALGDREQALRDGSVSVRLGERFLKNFPSRKPNLLTSQVRLDDVQALVGRLHLLYAATLLDSGRLSDAIAQVEESLKVMETSDKAHIERKTALQLYADVLDRVGRKEEANTATEKADSIPYRGFLKCLAPFRDNSK